MTTIEEKFRELEKIIGAAAAAQVVGVALDNARRHKTTKKEKEAGWATSYKIKERLAPDDEGFFHRLTRRKGR